MFIDRLFGGSAQLLRSKEPISICSKLDFWRVVSLEKDREVTLKNDDVRAPGEVFLKFRFKQNSDNSSTVQQTLIYRPKGLLGQLYYSLLQAPHKTLFTRLVDGLAG